MCVPKARNLRGVKGGLQLAESPYILFFIVLPLLPEGKLQEGRHFCLLLFTVNNSVRNMVGRCSINMLNESLDHHSSLSVYMYV